MDEVDTIATGLASPSKPMPYIYGDTDLYLDSSNASTTSSPMDPPYDITFQGMYPSPEHTDGSGEATQSSPQQSTKPVAKRKRENRYKNAPPSVLSRRRAQNRASQRAYRERKDQRIKDLEILLGEAQKKNDVLSQAYSSLQAEYVRLKREQEAVDHYQQGSLVYDPTISASGDMDLFLYNNSSSSYSM
ncbi:uncharacterized protein F4807DRAFT_402853 [Annulohypoxylon truncatum]|uniref:uncharacterized protein n=1 Tax=Annulohypoxylon truncatum TaxID=327061 RepID=UPI0020084377|nr:uncharacterized protein F4807DRAFT_402853 [Annulohypoxylon truncatum]KAI1211791.1 hypothetical protein F4807DRAFT_402853 [Annulohypoxylon truncatum]